MFTMLIMLLVVLGIVAMVMLSAYTKTAVKPRSVNVQMTGAKSLVSDEGTSRPTSDMAMQMFKQSWGTMEVESDTVVYDPQGLRVPGGVNLNPEIAEFVKPGMLAWNEARKNGATLEDAMKVYQSTMQAERQLKSLQTSTWNIPIWALEVFIATPGLTPISDLTPRVAVDRATIQAHPITTVGVAGNLTESSSTYTETDDTYAGGTLSNYAYAVTGIGRRNDITDLMLLTGGIVSNPSAVRAMAQLQAVKRFEEIQAIQGTTGGGGSASGFVGLADFATTGGTNTSKATGVTWPDDAIIAIETAIDAGANRATLACVTTSAIHQDMRVALQDYYRGGNPWQNFQTIGNGLDLKYSTLHIDDVPVFKSFGVESGSFYVFDWRTNYFAVVQPPMFKPLSRTGPFDRGATDTWECMVSEAQPHVIRYHSIP